MGSWVSLAILAALGAVDPGSNPGDPIDFCEERTRGAKRFGRPIRTLEDERSERSDYGSNPGDPIDFCGERT